MAGSKDLLSDGERSLESVKLLSRQPSFRVLGRWMLGVLAAVILVLFLPWQQNVQGYGLVTALRPEERPQEAVAAVGGRIAAWHVAEGTAVRAGDPIVELTEVQEGYLDPRTLERAETQVEQKRIAIAEKRAKAAALARQRDALDSAWRFARVKADNRIAQARASLAAAQLEDSIATVQAERAESLFAQGLRSRADLELARQRAQRAAASAIEQEAALGSAQADRSGVDAEYAEKIAKVEGDRRATLAEAAEGEADVAKLATGAASLGERRDLMVVRAPRDGIVVRALRAGIGEIVKDGEAIATVQPSAPRPAVALQVPARDVPLIDVGDKVRLEFDGWPAVQFSGWPSVAVGTFGGRVAVVDQLASPDGSYRVLVEPDSTDEAWPEELRLGSGARGWAMLRRVRVWFEIWRLMNGFPASVPSKGEATGAQAAAATDAGAPAKQP